MGTYDISKINNWFNDFTSAKKKFSDKYYSDFTNSYIRNCNDSAVVNMYNKLNQHYEKIKRINLRINNIWDDFLFDVQAIDNRLAGQRVSARDSLISSKLSKIQNLEEYESDLNTKISSLSAKIGIIDKIGLAENKSASENFAEVFERCGATVATFVTSLLEGIAKLGEDVVDLLALFGAYQASGYTVMIDLKNYITAEVKGDDSLKTNKTKQLWEETRSFVSTDYTGQIFNLFYGNITFGNWMKENAYGFDSVRAVGSEVGEVVGVIALSTVTGGSAAVIYGAAKTAEHTEENWQDQNVSTTGGLLKGMLQGSLDGAFFALGAKGDNIMKAAASSAVKQGEKIVLKKTAILFGKTMFECGCSIVQDESSILVNTIFSNNTIYDVNGEVLEFKNFKDKWDYYYKQVGGDEGLVISMATAGILSFMFDVSDITKAGKSIDVNNMKNIIDDTNSKNIEFSDNVKKANDNLDVLKKEYNELVNKTKEDWFIKAKEASDNGWAYDYNEVIDAENIVKRMQELEKTLDVKKNGVLESKIQAKKEADAMVQKIKNKPIPGFENIDTNSSEYKKAMQELYSKPSSSGRQYLSQAENNKNFKIIEDITGGAAANEQVLKKVDEITKLKEISKTTEKSLKNDITSSIMPDYNEIQKMRKIYIELNKRTNYDVDFVLGDKETQNAILNKFTTFDNLKNGNVVCKGWSELYAEALIESGIDPSRVKVVKAPKNNHWWVEIDMGDNIIRADATDAFLGSTDLANCKFGDSTNGFLILNKADSGFRVTNDTLKNYPEILKNSNDYFRDVDKTIDYVKDNKYFTENVTKLREAFSSTSSPYDDIIKQNDILKKNVHSFMNMDIPKNMNGYDAFAYYRKFSNTLFNGSNNAIPYLKKININGRDYSATIVEMFDGENKFYLTFDEINGKKIYTNEEYINGPSKNYEDFKKRG